MRALMVSFVVGVAAIACGSSDEQGLFSGNSGAGGGKGGASASGGSAGAKGGNGGAPTGGAGGSPSGGHSGMGGSSGAPVGGASGQSGSSGAPGGSGGAPAGGGTSGGSGTGAVGGAGGATGGSCVGHCGSSEPVTSGGTNCYCDALCTSTNDCCGDFNAVCVPLGVGVVNCQAAGVCDPAQYCCMAWVNSSYTPSCKPDGVSCSPGTKVECDGPEDCSQGQVCCGNFTSYWTGFSCMSPGSCTDWPTVKICTNNPSICGGDPCKQSQSIPQIYYCDPG